MGIVDTVIAIALLAGIVLIVVYWSKIKNWFSNLFGGIASIPGDVVNAAGTLLNPDNYADKSARFCCDVFTTDQILQMNAREYMPCNPGCNRESPGCIITADIFNGIIAGKQVKHTGKLTLDPSVKGCQGMVVSGSV